MMIIGKDTQDTDVLINNSKVKQVESIKYLVSRSVIKRHGGIHMEINSRMTIVNQLYYVLLKSFISKEISGKTKLKVYQLCSLNIWTGILKSDSWI